MRHLRLFVLIPSLIALTSQSALVAEESVPATAQESAAQTADATAVGSNAAAAKAKYVQASAAFQSAHFAEARELIDASILLNPSDQDAQALRENILAVLSVRSNRLQMAANWFRAMQDVKTQELAVRLQGLIESGDRKIASGDYAGAELDFDRVDIGLRSFPYKFDWGDLPKQMTEKRALAREKSRNATLERQAQAHSDAAAEATRQTALQEEALTNKVDELMRRARGAMARNDFKRAEVDAWNAYELDRRRDDARDLYLKARQGGHEQFDGEYSEQRLERISRVHEEIHKELIPQNEFVVYPEDWHVRSLRKAQELGSSKEEAWVVDLKDRLQQRITCNFVDKDFNEVVTWLRDISGISFVVAPDVLAGGVKNITLQVKDMRLEESVKWICTIASINWAIDKQAIFLSKSAIQGSAALRMYDVTDLVSPIVDFPGKEPGFSGITSNGGAGGGGAGSIFVNPAAGGGDANVMDINKLGEFIKKSIDPLGWKDDRTLEPRASTTLFINQSPENHAKIIELLDHMRTTQNLQVKIDVRLLDVKKGFFEEIGVEYQDAAITNSSNEPIDMITGGTTTDGYSRTNSNVGYTGNLTQSLPSNSTSAASGTQLTGRGLTVESAYNLGGTLGMNKVNAIFTALEQETDSQIIQQPELTVFNGQRANCSFITQYAYIQSYDVVSDNLDPKIATLIHGEILDVRPVVSSDRKYITLEMRPTSVVLLGTYIETLLAYKHSAVGGGGLIAVGLAEKVSYDIELPHIELRSLRTTVMLPDRGTLILGGYTQALRQRTHSGIPFLSHIPFLGRLFSKNGTYDENRRLFFMVSAEIYDQQERESQH